MLKESSIGKQVQEFSSKLLGWIPLSPNQITLVALLLAMGGFWLLVIKQYAIALLVFALSGFCDLLDGVVARARNQVSAKGAFLDGVTDRLVEFFLLFGLMFYPWPAFVLPGWMWLVILMFFGSAMTAFVTAYADHRKLNIQNAPSGMVSRAERLVLFLVILLLLVYNLELFAAGVLAFAALTSVGTFVERTWYFIRFGEEHPR